MLKKNLKLKNKKMENNLENRIEDLVVAMEKSKDLNEKINSLKFVFIKGLFQGLGIILGSTLLAGFLYYFFVTYLGLDFLKEWTLDYVSSENIK